MDEEIEKKVIDEMVLEAFRDIIREKVELGLINISMTDEIKDMDLLLKVKSKTNSE